MTTSSQNNLCQELNQQDLVEFLATLGLHPAKVRGNAYWYHSPFHVDRHPSLKVDRSKNVWYDHGGAQPGGGTLIDFGIRYYQCSVADFLRRYPSILPTSLPTAPSQSPNDQVTEYIRIESIQPLSSLSLLSYLRERRIPYEIARQFCQQLSIRVREKNHTVIGFANRSDGYEFRSRFIKLSNRPKDLSLIGNSCQQLLIFEGFFDFLSWKTINTGQAQPKADCCILNGTANHSKLDSILPQYEQYHLYLDNDNAGRELTRKILNEFPRGSDASNLYQGYKDLNQWHIQMGKGLQPRLRH
jgi:hypothetical protein